jgi:anaerobic magnesium-protoporphyrin IX monomethyl ester cyclase
MRVLLLNVPFTEGYHKASIDLPPLGIGYMASILRREGHEVQLLDLNMEPTDRLFRIDGADVVGISADTPRHPRAVQLGRRLRASNTPVVMGGPHASFCAESTLRSGGADYVVHGEGEQIMAELLHRIEEPGQAADVPGVSSLLEGEVVHGPPSQSVPDVGALPYPARDLLPMSSYQARVGNRKATSIIGSRGCPFNCSFCASSQLFGLRWRARDPEDLVDEMEYLQREYGLNAVLFMDDNFTLNPDRTVRICEEMLRRGLDMHWWCFSRANTVVDREDMVQAMAEAGAKQVFIGVESPNEEVLQDYNKGITADTAVQAVSLLNKHSIETYASFIIGDVFETKDMIRRTIRFASFLSPGLVQFAILTPYPGTQLYEQYADRLLQGKDWSFYDGLHAVLQPEYLQPEQLERFLKKSFLSFYLKPRNISLWGRVGKLLWYFLRS